MSDYHRNMVENMINTKTAYLRLAMTALQTGEYEAFRELMSKIDISRSLTYTDQELQVGLLMYTAAHNLPNEFLYLLKRNIHIDEFTKSTIVEVAHCDILKIFSENIDIGSRLNGMISRAIRVDQSDNLAYIIDYIYCKHATIESLREQVNSMVTICRQYDSIKCIEVIIDRFPAEVKALLTDDKSIVSSVTKRLVEIINSDDLIDESRIVARDSEYIVVKVDTKRPHTTGQN